ncbi:MAG: hypothetical protein RLZ98_3302 [Pseudomonadota bacterium]|jgi:hypothetical protein
MQNWLLTGAVLLVAVAAGGCTHEGFGSLDSHYSTFNALPAKGSTVHVCRAYGCRVRTKFTFGDDDMKAISKLMAETRRDDSAAEERRAVAYAIGWMERRVGNAIGTKADRPGMDFAASGDPSQQDCVDEATNTTSYLTVLANNKLLRHHTVGVPFAKENYLRGISGWTHWTAVLLDGETGKRWAVDSWIYANGENPAVVEAEKWYIASLEQLPAATR